MPCHGIAFRKILANLCPDFAQVSEVMRFKHYSLRTERMYQECSHKVVRQPNGTLLGICQCSPGSYTSYTVLAEVECSSLKLRRIWKILPALPACLVWVAQTWSLPYRRFVTCQAYIDRRAAGISHALQSATLRYSRLQVCATRKNVQKVTGVRR